MAVDGPVRNKCDTGHCELVRKKREPFLGFALLLILGRHLFLL